jgi:hypothetical protein
MILGVIVTTKIREQRAKVVITIESGYIAIGIKAFGA